MRKEKTMRKELSKFIKNMNGQTTLDEVAKVCKSTEELDIVLQAFQNIKKTERTPTVISVELKKRAIPVLKEMRELTTLNVQKALCVGYSTAVKKKDWWNSDEKNNDRRNA